MDYRLQMKRVAIGNRSGGELALWMIGGLLGVFALSQLLHAVADAQAAAASVATACNGIGAAK